MALSRLGHTVTLLTNGDVLVVGGPETGSAGSAELYDPGTGHWSPAGTAGERADFSTTLLNDGKVLVAGGLTYPRTRSVATATIYDPSTSTWQGTGSMNTPREGQTGTLLPSGQVLVAGGNNQTFGGGPSATLSSAELYEP
jgi:N-acetylneuraminic acid mutarotase